MSRHLNKFTVFFVAAILFGMAALPSVYSSTIPLTGAGVSSACTPAGAGVTLDPANKGTNVTLSGGNLTAVFIAAANQVVRATVSAGTGKYYYEIVYTLITTNAASGFENSSGALNNTIYSDTNGLALFSTDGHIYSNTVTDQGAYLGSSYTSTDRIGVALDGSNNHYWMRKNGAAWPNSGDPTTNANPGTSTGFPAGAIFPSIQGNNATATANFGTTAFTDTVPTGFCRYSS